MPTDASVKKLLIKFELSLKDAKKELEDFKRDLKQMNSESVRQAADRANRNKADLAANQQKISDEKRLQAEARTLLELDRAKAQWQRQQQESTKTRIQQTILETAQKKVQQAEEVNLIKLEQERIRLAQQQLRLQQQQAAALRQQSQRPGESGILGGIMGGLGKGAAGLLGGGPIGMIAAGAGIGEIAAHAFETLIDKVKEFGKEILITSGKEAQLAEQFEKLAKRAGEDPSEFLNKLRVATRGLADDMQLFKVANNFMQSGVKASGNDIARLTELTVNLARAQGKDATQAMQSLIRASLTGRTMSLAMATGLDRQALSLRGMSGHMDEVTRKTMEFQNVLQAMEKRFKSVGTPATTLGEVIQQVEVAEEHLIHSFGIGIAQNSGFQKTIQQLSTWLIQIRPHLIEVAEAIGEGLGNAIQRLTPLVTAAWSVLTSLASTVGALFTAFKNLLELDPVLHRFFDYLGGDNAQHLSFFQAEIMGIVTVLEFMAKALRDATISLTMWGNVAKGISHGSLTDIKIAFTEAKKQIDASNDQFWGDLEKATGQVRGATGKVELGPAGPKAASGNNVAAKQAIAKLEVEIQKEKDKQLLDSTLARLDAEKRALQNHYNDGLLMLAAYTDKEKSLVYARRDAELARIESDRKVQLQQVDESRAKGTPEAELKKQTELINLKAQGERVKAEETANKEIEALDQTLYEDQRQAKIQHEQGMVKLTQQSVQEQAKLLEVQFKQGLVSADEYLSQRRLILASDRDLQIEVARQTYDASKKNQVDLQKLRLTELEAEVNYEHHITELVQNEGEVRLAALTRKFSTMHSLLQSQLQLDQSKGLAFAPTATQDTRQLVDLVKSQIKDLVAEQDRLNAAGQRYTDDWYKLQTQINGAREQLIKMNQELFKSKDITGSISVLFGTAASKLSKIIPGKYSGDLSSFSSAMADIAKAGEQTAGTGRSPVGALGSSVRDLFGGGQKSVLFELKDASGKVVDSFTQITKVPLKERFTGFAKGLEGVLSTIGSFANAVGGAQSGGAGAVGGGMGGASLMKTMFAGTSMGGPVGMAVGAVMGGVLGGIFGHKNAQVQKDVEIINMRIRSVTDEMHAGAISLGDAIKQLEEERTKAISMLGGSKKGQKQLPAILEGLNSQIAQLLGEQKKTLDNLHQQIEMLSQPLAFQPLMQQLDDIIKKYKEFASAAAGNTAEVANANQYLVLSLQNYAQTMSTDVRSAEEEAIQNALTLIDLTKQRSQLLADEARQEYDVMTQGVTTRQRTTAMTKGEQIAQLRYQRDQQLIHLNEEISLAKYKFDSEQKIFGLRSTAVELEEQLLVLQEKDADKKRADVEALMQAITTITSATAGGIGGLPPGLLSPTGSIDPGLLAQLLGLQAKPMPGTGATGGQPHLADVPSIYQAMFDALDQNGFPNFTNEVIAAASTPFGSSQRYALWDELSRHGSPEGALLGKLGLVPHHGSDWDWQGLAGWLVNQATVASYQKGGLVDKTGPALLHGGELVVQSQVVKSLADLAQGKAPSWKGGDSSGITSTRLPIEQQIHDITAARTSMELDVIDRRTTLLALEGKHMSALRDLIQTMGATGNYGGVSSLEGALQKIYELRGRYGSGSFTRQQI